MKDLLREGRGGLPSFHTRTRKKGERAGIGRRKSSRLKSSPRSLSSRHGCRRSLWLPVLVCSGCSSSATGRVAEPISSWF